MQKSACEIFIEILIWSDIKNHYYLIIYFKYVLIGEKKDKFIFYLKLMWALTNLKCTTYLLD